MFGRCTFTTTTGRPSRSAARWTWPSEAAAIGSVSKRENALEILTPSSAITTSSTSA